MFFALYVLVVSQVVTKVVQQCMQTPAELIGAAADLCCPQEGPEEAEVRAEGTARDVPRLRHL